MKPATRKTVYLVETELSERCFLEEVLYWVAFQRLPVCWFDFDGIDARSYEMPGYEVDVAFHPLTLNECERSGLPEDPRISFHWSSDVKLDDDLETIMAMYEKNAEKTAQDD